MWFIEGKLTNNLEFVKEYFGLKYLPMVRSSTDTDSYKLSMGQAYHHQFGNLKAVWDFNARNVGIEAEHEKYTI